MNSPSYIADQPWMHTYQSVLSPHSMKFMLGLSGIAAPEIRNYCELAHGQGLTLLLHAAANQEISWVGTDFNEGHASGSAAIARTCGLDNLKICNDSLTDFLGGAADGQFDAMAMMGTWSWLPPAEQQAVAGMLARKMSDKGLFILDHCTLPGLAAAEGLWRIFSAIGGREHRNSEALVSAIPQALKTTLAFFDVNPSYVVNHWHMRASVEKLLAAEPAHVAHEYFNYHARPRYFGELAEELASGGLSWASMGEPNGMIDALHLTPRQAEFLKSVEGDVRREQLRDFVLDTSWRCDIWTTGSRPDRKARAELLADVSFIRARASQDLAYKVSGALGEIALSRELYGAINTKIGSDPITIKAIHASLTTTTSLDDVIDACTILFGAGHILPVKANSAHVTMSLASSARFNAHVLRSARISEAMQYLASPLTGMGVKVPRLHQLLLLARMDGTTDLAKGVQLAAEAMPTVSKDIITRDAADFRQHSMPVYEGLGLLGNLKV